MGLNLYDANGFVDILGSAFAWWNVIHEVEKHRAKGPLYDFTQTGKTRDPAAVLKDIVQILPTVNNKDVRDSLETLQTKLKQCSEVAIVYY